MTAPDYTLFKNSTHIGKDDVTNNLETGTVEFLRWGFLNIGAFQNITRSPAISGVYGGNKSRLAPVVDPNYTTGKVWQGYRSDWVWESGVGFSPAPQPAQLLVNGSSIAPTHTTLGHYIDYPRGRVVFNTTQSTSLNVAANFAHRTVSVCEANNNPAVQELMFNSYSIERDEFLSTGSGNWNQVANDIRRQLPLVAVEVVSGKSYPYAIGGGEVVKDDLLLYVFSDNDTDLKQITDTLRNQNDKTIWLIDRALMKTDSRFPVSVDYKGAVVSSPMTYPSLVEEVADSGFRWRTATFGEGRVQYMPVVNSWLYRSVVRFTTEVIVP